MSFITVEDVNTTQYNNQGFWWHTIDTSVIDHDGNTEFTDVVFDFCKISKEKRDSNWRYIVEVDNSFWTKGTAFVDKNDKAIFVVQSYTDKGFNVSVSEKSSPIKILLYMGIQQVTSDTLRYYLKDNVLNLNLKQLNSIQGIKVYNRYTSEWVTILMKLSRGFNEIKDLGGSAGFVLVKLLKTDFQFNCTQSLTVGKVNTVSLGANDDYKKDGVLLGNQEPVINVEYDGETLPVTWNSQLNDYAFDLDLTEETIERKIRFKVIVNDNYYLNGTETDVVLESRFELINTMGKLVNLFKTGGTGRLSSNIQLTNDLILSENVLLVGNDKRLNLDLHKIIVPSDKTFKVQGLTFQNGKNTIQQYTGSTVEVMDCIFNLCSGLGSVIDCQIDTGNLSINNDFTTVLNNCTFSNNTLCILHGGDLTVTNCTVTGLLYDHDYPFFLYQTDGSATLLNNSFNVKTNEKVNDDLMFNTCIFMCGETAQVNGLNHSELSNNNLTDFLTGQNNRSEIDVTYKYPAIDDYINLKSDNGYCHGVSGVDFVFKTNIDLLRGE